MFQTLKKMFGGKKEAAEVLSPVSGSVVPLSEVNDPAFAQEILGKGVAVKPSEGEFKLATGMEHVLKILESEQVDECYMHLEADGYVGDLY